MAMATVLLAALVASSSAQAATPKCTTLETGNLWTNTFRDASENEIRRRYAFNSRNEVAYFKTGTKPPIAVEFQVPAQPDNFGRYYGRFYITKTKQCLAVSNPKGAPPYYVASKPCPAPNDIATDASIPFNFIGYQNDEINYQWYGATIPSKQKYQGPEPGATNCQGSYAVNATDVIKGHKQPGRGEPSTSSSKDEMNRIHLYCPKDKSGNYVSAFNTFILLNS
ncbi:hypothetical protein FRC07_001736 [Ceratobasidium sp. 392]|nr:hypothetical protein FRC07_001736 [Ceratobasidium sp. 392]